MDDLLNRADEEARSGRQDKAFILYGQILAKSPSSLGALKGAARTLMALRRLDDSAEAWRAALDVAPDDPDTLFQCGMVHFRRGEMEEARRRFNDTSELEPSHYGALGMNVLALLYQGGDVADTLWRAQRVWAEQHAPSPIGAHTGEAEDPERRLRIGFVSSDFRAHSVGFNMLPVFQRLDRNKFQIHSYAEVAHPDKATGLFENASDVWRSTVGMHDPQVAQMILSDKIDILIFLAAHLDENRPFISRFCSAPIQVSHHDVCTSALPEIDYFLGDLYVTPPGGAEEFSERVVRLPTFTVHSIPAEAVAPNRLPAQANGYITFGSFNAPQKISDACLDAWAAILQAVPESLLVLKYFESYSEAATRARVLGRLSSAGIDLERLTILDAVDPRSEHLRAYGDVDIALDPFPFSGATTTFEALLMGVPVISLSGTRLVERCSAATLDAAGLSVCIASDVSSYIVRATELASDTERLAVLRGALRTMVTQSRVCDADSYVRNIGRVYRAMWRRWCASLASL